MCSMVHKRLRPNDRTRRSNLRAFPRLCRGDIRITEAATCQSVDTLVDFHINPPKTKAYPIISSSWLPRLPRLLPRFVSRRLYSSRPASTSTPIDAGEDGKSYEVDPETDAPFRSRIPAIRKRSVVRHWQDNAVLGGAKWGTCAGRMGGSTS